MNQEDEDQEALEDEKHRDVNKSCLGRALKSFISLDSFHRNNILLGTAFVIFSIIGKPLRKRLFAGLIRQIVTYLPDNRGHEKFLIFDSGNGFFGQKK